MACAIVALIALPAPTRAAHTKLVYRVDRVSAVIANGRLIVEVTGAVPTGGWKHPRLRARPSVPEARVLYMEFLADPPNPKRVVIDALLPMKAELRTGLPHYGTVAIGVISQTNEITTQIVPN